MKRVLERSLAITPPKLTMAALVDKHAHALRLKAAQALARKALDDMAQAHLCAQDGFYTDAAALCRRAALAWDGVADNEEAVCAKSSHGE